MVMTKNPIAFFVALAGCTSSTTYDDVHTGATAPGTCTYSTALVSYHAPEVITQASLAAAVAQADSVWSSDPDSTVVIAIPAGTFDITAPSGDTAAIDLSGLNASRPSAKGRLVFQGAGPDATTLVFTEPRADAIFGRDVYRVSFCDMHMTRARPTATQGRVVGSLDRTGAIQTATPFAGNVVVDIDEGYPRPDEIYNAESDQGRYLRRYLADPNASDAPVVVVDDNEQVPWSSYVMLTETRWALYSSNPAKAFPYAPGDWLGIKSKHEGNTYRFLSGRDAAFENVRWTEATRGIARSGFSSLRFEDVRVERGPAIGGVARLLASSSGGPQVGNPDDPRATGVSFEGGTFVAQGDDAIGLFNVDDIDIRGVTISDSFARAIYLDSSVASACLTNVRMYRNAIQHDNPDFQLGCRADATPPPVPSGLAAVAGDGYVRLTWTPVSASDLAGYVVRRSVGDGEAVTIASGIKNPQLRDPAVMPGKSYRYTVRSMDASRNTSAPSAGVNTQAR